ncbi:MAG: hypothetical protein IPM71_10090 [Bacteroidota bacterium]|nr:MAG: hypothetical protein IPM71_10090 [Bacteroidota bacterium]
MAAGFLAAIIFFSEGELAALLTADFFADDTLLAVAFGVTAFFVAGFLAFAGAGLAVLIAFDVAGLAAVAGFFAVGVAFLTGFFSVEGVDFFVGSSMSICYFIAKIQKIIISQMLIN